MRNIDNYNISTNPNAARRKSKTGRQRIVLAVVVALGFLNISYAKGADRSATPDGLTDYAVFMATGTIPFAPHPNPSITGCGGFIFCDGDYFHEVIMGRDAGQIAEEASRAKAYFRDRFGVDVDDPALAGRIDFFSFYLDPRGEYRAYTMAGEKIPARGWEVRDGGFIAMVIDPAGIELGGEFAGSGLVVQSGGLLLFGNYNIQKTNRWGKPKGEIVYSYRSDMPMTLNDWGELVVNCQISVSDFADGEHDGKAQGMGMPLVPDANGFTLSWRNVLTLERQ